MLQVASFVHRSGTKGASRPNLRPYTCKTVASMDVRAAKNLRRDTAALHATLTYMDGSFGSNPLEGHLNFGSIEHRKICRVLVLTWRLVACFVFSKYEFQTLKLPLHA